MKTYLYGTAMILAMVLATSALASPVLLDISTSFNYDAVGTQNEINYSNTQSGNHRIRDILGQHDMQYGRCYLGDNASGLPADGLIDGGNFELGKGLASRYDVPAGDTLQPNTIHLAPNAESLSAEVSLPAGQQQKYASINFAFVGSRYGFEPSKPNTYTASIEVLYADDAAWHTIWSSTGNNTTAGGSFGSGGVDGLGGWNKPTDTAEFALAHSTTKIVGSAGSSGSYYSNIRSDPSYIWKFSSDLTLDGTKVMEKFRINVSTTGVNRPNAVDVFAASATPVPEPATLGLLVIGGLSLIRRRR